MASFFIFLPRHLQRDMLGDESRPADPALRRLFAPLHPDDRFERQQFLQRAEQMRLEKGGLC